MSIARAAGRTTGAGRLGRWAFIPTLAAALAATGWAGVAHAAERSFPPGHPGPITADPAEPPRPQLDPKRLELAALPILSAGTDTGLGLGANATLARFDDGYHPHRWRVDLTIFIAGRGAPGGGVEFPVQHHEIRLDLQGLAGGRLRLTLSPSFSRDTTARYFGLGNASEQIPRWEQYDPETQRAQYIAARRYYQYRRTEVASNVGARMAITRRGFGFAGGTFAYESIDSYPSSKLREDLMGRSGPYVASQLQSTSAHGLVAGMLGLGWDSRDHEIVPSRGMFHEVSFRGGHGLGGGTGYGGANLTARFYFPLWQERLVLASRFILDALFGTPRLYDLGRFGGLYPASGPGGGAAVRGVPTGRYAGKLKAIGNVELRARILPFVVAQQRFSLGAVAFVDAGRVRADFADHLELDAGARPLKYGAGGGLRLQWGEAFLVRADAAESTDGFGAEFGINHIF